MFERIRAKKLTDIIPYGAELRRIVYRKDINVCLHPKPADFIKP